MPHLPVNLTKKQWVCSLPVNNCISNKLSFAKAFICKHTSCTYTQYIGVELLVSHLQVGLLYQHVPYCEPLTCHKHVTAAQCSFLGALIFRLWRTCLLLNESVVTLRIFIKAFFQIWLSWLCSIETHLWDTRRPQLFTFNIYSNNIFLQHI